MRTHVLFFFLQVAVYILQSLVAEADDLQQCPSHIERNLFLRIYKDKCYQFIFTEKIKWIEANSHCKNQGGTLITIERKDIQDFVERMLTNVTLAGSRLWIGATDKDKEQNWKWVTDQSVSTGYSKWEEGSPSCYIPEFLCREDCACLLLEEGFKWHQTFCAANDFQYGFICQYNMPTSNSSKLTTRPPVAGFQPTALPLRAPVDDASPNLDNEPFKDDGTHRSTEQMTSSTVSVFGADKTEQCPPHIDRNLLLQTYNQTCYQFIFTEKKKWFDAKSHCEQQKGNLITIERKEVQDFLEQTLTNVSWVGSRLWIGATDNKVEQDWKWVTGGKVSAGYKKWTNGSPSCHLPENENLCQEDCACLLIEQNFTWHQTFCSANGHEYGFICQYDMLPEADTTTVKPPTSQTAAVTTTTAATATPSLTSSQQFQNKTISKQNTTLTTTPKQDNTTSNVAETTFYSERHNNDVDLKTTKQGLVLQIVAGFAADISIICCVILGISWFRKRDKRYMFVIQESKLCNNSTDDGGTAGKSTFNSDDGSQSPLLPKREDVDNIPDKNCHTVDMWSDGTSGKSTLNNDDGNKVQLKSKSGDADSFPDDKCHTASQVQNEKSSDSLHLKNGNTDCSDVSHISKPVQEQTHDNTSFISTKSTSPRMFHDGQSVNHKCEKTGNVDDSCTNVPPGDQRLEKQKLDSQNSGQPNDADDTISRTIQIDYVYVKT